MDPRQPRSALRRAQQRRCPDHGPLLTRRRPRTRGVPPATRRPRLRRHPPHRELPRANRHRTWHGNLSVPASIAKTVNHYGPLGRLEWSTDPKGVKTSYTYDDDGKLLATTLGPNATDTAHQAKTSYDLWGNASTTAGPADVDPDGASIQAKTTYTYDNAGRVRSQIDGDAGPAAEKLITTFVYDAAGRPFRTIEHRNGTLDTANPAAIALGDKVTESRYSLAGRTKVTTEPGVDNANFNWSGAD